MINIIIELEQHQGLSWPTYHFNLENSIISQVDVDEHTRLVTHSLDSNTVINIDYTKHPSETIVQNGQILRDQSLIIKNIYADEILLDLNLVLDLSEFLPKYNQQFLTYCEANNIPVDMGPMHIGSFFHPGTWTFTFADDFWTWYQNARRLRDARYTTLSQKEKDLYIGNTSEQHQLLLNKLQVLLK